MASVRDAQRFRKVYSYYKQRPREEVMGAGVSETIINGLDWKHSVRAATTANVTLSPAPAAVDGVTLAADDRVLVKDQSTASENGIYYYDAGLGDLVRTPDASDPALTSGAAVFAEEGTTNAGCAFVLVTPDPISVGTTSLSWVKFAGAGSSIFTSSVSPLVAKTNYSVSIDTDSRYASEIGSDVFFFVSGSTDGTSKSVFGGDLFLSGGFVSVGNYLEMTGTIAATQGFSGSLTRLTDDSSFVVGGAGISVVTGSNGAITLTQKPVLQFLAGTSVSDQPSSSMTSVGMDYFEVATLPTNAVDVVFTAVLAATSGTTAYMDLYDYNGILTGFPGPVSGSVVTGSSETYAVLSASLPSLLAVTGSGLIEARMWCTPAGASLNAICKNAKLIVK